MLFATIMSYLWHGKIQNLKPGIHGGEFRDDILHAGYQHLFGILCQVGEQIRNLLAFDVEVIIAYAADHYLLVMDG